MVSIECDYQTEVKILRKSKQNIVFFQSLQNEKRAEIERNSHAEKFLNVCLLNKIVNIE